MKTEQERIDKIRGLQKVIEDSKAEIWEEEEAIRAMRKFSWQRFGILCVLITAPPFMFYLNMALFPSTSIWSWHHYFN